MLKYLWKDLSHLWDNFHLLFALEMLGKYDFHDGIREIMQSSVAENIFLGMQVKEQINFIKKLVTASTRKMQLQAKDTIKGCLAKGAYAT